MVLIVQRNKNVEPPIILHSPAGAATIKPDEDDVKVLPKAEPEDHASPTADAHELELVSDEGAATTATELESMTQLAGESAVVNTALGEVMHAVWSPKDPSRLATAGTGALARVWHFAPPPQLALTGSAQSNTLQAAPAEIPGPHARAPWVVTSMVWHPSECTLAVAAHNALDVFDHQVALWRDSGALLAVCATSAMPAVELQWNPPGSILLGVCAGDYGSEVQLWEPASSDMMDSLPLTYLVEQSSWAGPDTFWLYGERTLELYRFAAMGCSAVASFDIMQPGVIYFMRADPISQLLVTSSANGFIDASYRPFLSVPYPLLDLSFLLALAPMHRCA
jgi:WD40 repeat protein